jgi:hypothetical protein
MMRVQEAIQEKGREFRAEKALDRNLKNVDCDGYDGVYNPSTWEAEQKNLKL